MQLSANYGLKLMEGIDNVKRQDFVDNFTKIDSTMKAHEDKLNDLTYQTAGGTGTAITLILPTLANGYAKTFIASANNGGVVTTINGKKLYKPGTTTSPNLITGKAYTVWYNTSGDCFFIKASAEGNTVTSHVLAGDTFSNDTDTGLIGTMANQPYQVTALSVGSNGTNKYFRIPLGAYLQDGAGTGVSEIVASATQIDSNIVASNIKSGTSICGISGSSTVVDTADAVLDRNFLVQGYSGYDDGVLKNGTMVNRSAENWHQPSIGETVSNANGYGVYLIPPAGYYNGSSWIRSLQPDLVASNIINGKSIFGLAGSALPSTYQCLSKTEVVTATSANYQSWSKTYDYKGYNVPYTIALPFTPKILIYEHWGYWIRSDNGVRQVNNTIYHKFTVDNNLFGYNGIEFMQDPSSGTLSNLSLNNNTLSANTTINVAWQTHGSTPNTHTIRWFAATW